jgi:carbamoyltransferase
MRVLAFSVAHDSSVCSINDGQIEFFCKEERLTRVKRDNNPFKSLELYKSLNFGKIDHALYITPTSNEYNWRDCFSIYFEKTFNFNEKLEDYSQTKHHLLHASLAFYNSEFEKCLVFVIDRDGAIFLNNQNVLARESHSVYECSYPNNIIPINKAFYLNDEMSYHKRDVKDLIESKYPNCDIQVNNEFSIVKVYEAATTLIGQHPLENGKTMGLSSYGENLSYDKLFLNEYPIDQYFTMINTSVGTITCFYDDVDKITKEINENNFQFYANKAKHVQIETQKVALELIEKYVSKTGITNVCLVGGYALNVVANNFYTKHLPNVNFYFEPVADDTGISIGAAMHKYRTLTGDSRIIVPKDNFYHYYASEPSVDGKSCDVEDLVDILIAQKTLAIFEGQPEVGPRALGHRSILFDPRNKDTKYIVNKVKKREWYRPFAGVILKDHFQQYFETLNLTESSYMTINFECKPETKEYVPGIVHVDNTCRVQTVSNGFLFNLLTAFYKRTGCPMLLNTSFNLAGEALVHSKQDAINTLMNSNLNFVYFVDDKKLISK